MAYIITCLLNDFPKDKKNLNDRELLRVLSCVLFQLLSAVCFDFTTSHYSASASTSNIGLIMSANKKFSSFLLSASGFVDVVEGVKNVSLQ